jgi:hypothetical protein
MSHSSIRTACKIKKGWFGKRIITEGKVESDDLMVSRDTSELMGKYLSNTCDNLYEYYKITEGSK